MGTRRFILLKKTHFDFIFGFMHGFLCRNMSPVVHSFWVFLSKFIVHVFRSIIGYFFRFPTDRYLQEIDSGACLDSNFDHVDQGNREGENSSMVASTSKYEFLYRNGISGFIEEPTTASYAVHELYTDSNDYNNGGTIDSSVSAEGDAGKVEVEKVENSIESFKETDAVFEDKTEESALRFSFSVGFEKQIKQEQSVEANDSFEQKTENFDEQKGDDSVENFIFEKLLEKPKQENETEDIFEEKAEESLENYITENILQKHVSGMEGNNDNVKEKFWEFLESPEIDKYIEKWQREKDELTPENHPPSDAQKVEIMEQEIHEQKTSFSDQDEAISRGPIDYSDDEFIELEPWSEKFSVTGETQAAEDSSFEDEDGEEERTLQEEEEDDQEFGSEHDDLLERLKMELKMARTGGLPTILEDSESPKIVQELGPLQIDEKFDHKDHVAEIQKVYKSYSDKMRKLDILNSQTMHAISLLQLKDSVRPSTSEKSSAPAMKSLLSSFKQRKPEADPAMKLVGDLCKDFETVYVGQVCLSWEILHWQFGKVKQLFESDRHGVRQYNQVAGEFQRFQVLVQRFLEDEPFQARPRVENYVKNRCALRNFLQVPVIKGKKTGLMIYVSRVNCTKEKYLYINLIS
ncbi:hypothetical protein DITRI_Ditri17bG0125200 [Diplodiscus trichospermus]